MILQAITSTATQTMSSGIPPTPIWQIILWILNVLFFLVITFIGFWFKNFLATSFAAISEQFKEINIEIKAIREEMQKGAVNFNTNNIEIVEIKKRVDKVENTLEGLRDEHNKCAVCHKVLK